MGKHLYFVCPTDHLEHVIDTNLGYENYYVTSLGNSITFNPELIKEINSLIKTKSISEITFVLSDNNSVILDALRSQDFNNIRGLESFYNTITDRKRSIETLWQILDIRIPIISYYLDLKIKELQLRLNNWLPNPIGVNAKIYNKQNNTYIGIHTDLLHLAHFSLN